ncbi:MAG TPA: methylated-DNA--[protein]-cysteine S-methyltransferase [Longimicrobium sp.]|nr:methylated-DNA--[protein]-cysteine S-methyltransferase [Longimicrobium sp.]
MTISDYQRIERAIGYLEANYHLQPSLADAARSVHLSEFHFQRLFRRWAGISPKRFLQFLTVEHAKRLLAESRPLLDAAYGVGLSGPGRLHDLFVALEAVTPGEYKARGESLSIRYGFADTPFGPALIASTDRGVCALAFLGDEGEAGALADLERRWPGAVLREDAAGAARLAARIFGDADGSEPLALHVAGTNFQVRVWEALLRLPAGHLTTYEDLAASIGRPGAARAVAGAVAANPVGYVIPCHRVIRKLGVLGGYRWGPSRKKAIVGWESARRFGDVEVGEEAELAVAVG